MAGIKSISSSSQFTRHGVMCSGRIVIHTPGHGVMCSGRIVIHTPWCDVQRTHCYTRLSLRDWARSAPQVELWNSKVASITKKEHTTIRSDGVLVVTIRSCQWGDVNNKLDQTRIRILDYAEGDRSYARTACKGHMVRDAKLSPEDIELSKMKPVFARSPVHLSDPVLRRYWTSFKRKSPALLHEFRSLNVEEPAQLRETKESMLIVVQYHCFLMKTLVSWVRFAGRRGVEKLEERIGVNKFSTPKKCTTHEEYETLKASNVFLSPKDVGKGADLPEQFPTEEYYSGRGFGENGSCSSRKDGAVFTNK